MQSTVYTIFEECEHGKELGKCGRCKEHMRKEFESFQDLNNSIIQDDTGWATLIRSVEYDRMYR